MTDCKICGGEGIVPDRLGIAEPCNCVSNETYWFHPESDCYFKHTGAIDLDLASNCDQITKQQYLHAKELDLT